MADYRPPPYPFVPNVAHYYGDHVRTLFIVTAALLLVTAPFYANSLRVELPFEILFAMVLVAIGALANPHGKWIFMAGAVVAGIGLVIYEMWALYQYNDSTLIQFVLRELIAMLFLVAFYFNMKTVRAFLLGKVGTHGHVGEFDNEGERRMPSIVPPPRKREARDEFVPWVNSNALGRPDAKAEAVDSPSINTPGRSREEIMPKYHPYEEQL